MIKISAYARIRICLQVESWMMVMFAVYMKCSQVDIYIAYMYICIYIGRGMHIYKEDIGTYSANSVPISHFARQHRTGLTEHSFSCKDVLN